MNSDNMSQESLDAMRETISEQEARTMAEFNEGYEAAQAAAVAGDEIALHRAEIARLRAVLTTIRDYPIVESEMEVGHQVAGMVLQAEVALVAEPPKSGLLTILSKRNMELQAELAVARQREARLTEALKPLIGTLNDYALEEAREVWGNTNVSVAKHHRDNAAAALAQSETEALAATLAKDND